MYFFFYVFEAFIAYVCHFYIFMCSNFIFVQISSGLEINICPRLETKYYVIIKLTTSKLNHILAVLANCNWHNKVFY